MPKDIDEIFGLDDLMIAEMVKEEKHMMRMIGSGPHFRGCF